ncbi:hypothetical protein [Succinimonas sp.]|uniref:hypothetical protein n=1 Tax=Succinimonas sp. TaxID=1936151 RepID=UPI00386CF19A
MKNNRLTGYLAGTALFVLCQGVSADTLPPFNPFGTPAPGNQQAPAPVNPAAQAALQGYWQGTATNGAALIFYFAPDGTGFMQINGSQGNFSYVLSGNVITINDGTSSVSFEFAAGQDILQLKAEGNVATFYRMKQQPGQQPNAQQIPQPVPQPAPQPQTPALQLSGKYQCSSPSMPRTSFVYDFTPANYAVYVTVPGTKLRDTFMEYGSYRIEGEQLIYTVLQHPVATMVGQTGVNYLAVTSDGFLMRTTDTELHCARKVN